MKKTIQFTAVFFLVFLFESCSWRHVFLVKNNTSTTWEISYQINHEDSIFKKDIVILNSKKDTAQTLLFPDGKVHFSLQSKQLAIIATGRNMAYNSYRDYPYPNDKTPWAPFLNIDSLVVTNGSFRAARHGQDLKEWLGKILTLSFLQGHRIFSKPLSQFTRHILATSTFRFSIWISSLGFICRLSN